MNRRISQRELRNDSGRILRDVQAGETVTVTSRGVPVAELSPAPSRESGERGRFVDSASLVKAFRDILPIDGEALREDLDRHIDNDPTPRV